MKEKKTKGHYGYLKRRKRTLALICIGLAVGAAGLILIGYFVSGNRINLLSLLAAVSLIPFAMSLATLLSLLGFHSAPEEEYEAVLSYVKNGVLDCDLVVANKDGKSFFFPFLYVHETGLYGLLASSKTDPEKVAEYVRNYLRLNEADGPLTIYTDFSVFTKRLSALTPSDRNSCSEKLLRQEGVLRAISM